MSGQHRAAITAADRETLDPILGGEHMRDLMARDRDAWEQAGALIVQAFTAGREQPGADAGVTLTGRQVTALRALLLAATEPGRAATGRWEDVAAGAAWYAAATRPPLEPAEYDDAVSLLFPRHGRRRRRTGNPTLDNDPHWWVWERPGAPRPCRRTGRRDLARPA